MWHWQPSIFYSDEKCEILTLPLNKQRGDLTVYSVLGCFIHLWQNYYVSEVCSLFMMGVWLGVTLIHLIFLLFVAICVLRGQALRQSLGYKVFVRDQHLWREREERDFVERVNERLCRSDKDSCTQRGAAKIFYQMCLEWGQSGYAKNWSHVKLRSLFGKEPRRCAMYRGGVGTFSLNRY